MPRSVGLCSGEQPVRKMMADKMSLFVVPLK